MKFTEMLSSLHRSTKATIVVCSCIVLVSALAMVALMFFPLTPSPRETQAVIPAAELPEETEEETTLYTTTRMPMTTADLPQTKSTWNAGISGYSRSMDEFRGTTVDWMSSRLGTRTTTTTIATTKAYYTTTTAASAVSTAPSSEWTESDTSEMEFSVPELPNEDTIPPSTAPTTYTTTVAQTQPPATELTNPPAPVVTDPPAPVVVVTDPPAPVVVVTDPPAPPMPE